MAKEICVEVSDMLNNDIEKAMLEDRFEDKSDFIIQCIRMYLRKSIGKGTVDTKNDNRLDPDIIVTRMTKSQREESKHILDIIYKLQKDHDGKAPISEVIQRAEEVGIDEIKAKELIKLSKREGSIFEPRVDFLKALN